MTGRAYYNEIDPFAARWLRELIAAGVIPAGEVDERDIRDVRPSDLGGFVQCHFFAGIGVWPYALRLADWPDDDPVWTGSCPCQPFSSAGGRAGFADERHLWPAFLHLVRVGRPDVILGEQVASLDGLAWLDLVHADLEGEAYACGAVDLCAAGVGAPNIRQRLWWMAHSDGQRLHGGGGNQRGEEGQRGEPGTVSGERGASGALADAMRAGRAERRTRPGGGPVAGGGGAGELGDAGRARLSPRQRQAVRPEGRGQEGRATAQPGGAPDGLPGPVNGFWRDADWLWCRDGKYRPVEPGSFPLAHGASGRVGRLRGYGNAINAQAAAHFIRAARAILVERGVRAEA